MNLALKSVWKGVFTLQAPQGLLRFVNTVTNGGADFLVKGLAGAIDQPKITHIYLRFGSVLPGISGIEEATAQTFKDPAASSGTLFIPLLCPATLSTTEEGTYLANKATFEFAVPADSVIGDATGVWASNSAFVSGGQLFAIGAVAAQLYGDRANDILVAASDISGDGVTITAGTYRSGNYTVQLEL